MVRTIDADSQSWIKLYRKVIDGGWLQNPKLWALWSYLLLKASHKKYKQIIGYQSVELEPGQLIFGRKAASKDLKMSEQSIRTCLNYLSHSQNITINSTNRFSVVSICNWESYQGGDNGKPTSNITNKQPASNQQVTSKTKINGQPDVLNNSMGYEENINLFGQQDINQKIDNPSKSTTNKNNKKNKNIKNNITSDISPEIVRLYDFFISTLPERYIPKSDKIKHEWLDALDKCNRIDGYKIWQIHDVIDYFRNDDEFWKTNFYSPLKLRLLNKDRIKYIDFFYEKIKDKIDEPENAQ